MICDADNPLAIALVAKPFMVGRVFESCGYVAHYQAIPMKDSHLVARFYVLDLFVQWWFGTSDGYRFTSYISRKVGVFYLF